MSLLLDTHALIWWSADDPQLAAQAAAAIRVEPIVYVSAASVFEITSKHRSGKLPKIETIVDNLARFIADEGFRALPISVAHAQIAGTLPGPVRDPFDRLLIAQAMAEDLRLVSIERPFDAYPIKRVW